VKGWVGGEGVSFGAAREGKRKKERKKEREGERFASENEKE